MSMTATMTRGSPVVNLQASLIFISAPATAPSAIVPSLIRGHWSSSSKSLNGSLDAVVLLVPGLGVYSIDSVASIGLSIELYWIAVIWSCFAKIPAAVSTDISLLKDILCHLLRLLVCLPENTGAIEASSSPSSISAVSRFPSDNAVEALCDNFTSTTPSSFSPKGLPTSFAGVSFCPPAMPFSSFRQEGQQIAAVASTINSFFIFYSNAFFSCWSYLKRICTPASCHQ